MHFKSLSLIVISLFILSFPSHAENNIKKTAPQTKIRDYTQFFDESLNDMQEESEIATEEGKKGILLMFEMDECPFCKRMKKTVLNRTEVQDYFKNNFRVLSVDIEGDLELTDFKGKDTTQKEFSLKQFRVRATPVFQFLDLKGEPLKNGRLTGATRDSKEFMMFGKYIAEGSNEKIPFLRYKRQQKKAEK